MTERQLKTIINEEINNILKENKTYDATEYLKSSIIKIGKIGQYLSTQTLPTIYKQSFASKDVDLTIKSLIDFKFLLDSHVQTCYGLLDNLIEEVKNISNVKEELMNESNNNYTVADFPIGSLVHFQDGEVWQVVDASKVSTSRFSRLKGNQIHAKPFNSLAKQNNVSVAIDFDIDYLNSEVVEIEL
jgi:hypothetical protein